MTQETYYTIDTFDLDDPPESSTFSETKCFKNKSRLGKVLKNSLVPLTATPTTTATETTTTEDEPVYDTICFELPDYFTDSQTTNKSVELQYIHLLQRKKIIDPNTGDPIYLPWDYVPATMHSDLVQFRPNADYYVCATNVMYTWTKKFVIPAGKKSFDLWFRTMDGAIVNLDPTLTRVIVELLLAY